jgi:hypothetical protein
MLSEQISAYIVRPHQSWWSTSMIDRFADLAQRHGVLKRFTLSPGMEKEDDINIVPSSARTLEKGVRSCLLDGYWHLRVLL